VLDSVADLSGAMTNPAGILQIDTTGTPSGPAVTSVETSGNGITAGTGDLNVGAVVTLTLHLSEPVSVSTLGGVPTLLLNDGGVATFAGGSGSNTLIFSYTVAAGQNTADLAVTAVDLNGAVVVASPSTIAPGSGQSLTDAYGHVFTFGNAYQGGDYHILRDGVSDGIAATLALVNGVVFAHTASFGWYADSAGHFIYQQTAPVLDSVADLSGAVTNPAGILQIDTMVNGVAVGQKLTYLVKIDGVAGDSTLKDYTDYLTVDEFTFGELTKLSGNTGGGAGTGKAQLDPLVVDLAGEPAGLATLLKDAAAGSHISNLDLVGLSTVGGKASQVYDLKLSNVTVAGIAIDGGHDTAPAFNYANGSETIKGQNKHGSLDAGKTANFDASTTAVDHDALASFAHAHSDYLV
jgi:type VI protein secretion system component Hcp